MQEELEIIQKLGVVTLKEIEEKLTKSKRNILVGVSKLEKIGDIKILCFKEGQYRRSVYVTKELYNHQFKA